MTDSKDLCTDPTSYSTRVGTDGLLDTKKLQDFQVIFVDELPQFLFMTQLNAWSLSSVKQDQLPRLAVLLDKGGRGDGGRLFGNP